MIAAKKMLLMPSSARPFVMSGSFEVDTEGWTPMVAGPTGVEDLSGGSGLVRVTGRTPRTGSWNVYGDNSANTSDGRTARKGIFRRFAASSVKGLSLRISCFAYTDHSTGLIARMYYKIGNSALTQISDLYVGSSYEAMSGQIPKHTAKEDLYVEISFFRDTVNVDRGNLRGGIDDWRIEGVRA